MRNKIIIPIIIVLYSLILMTVNVLFSSNLSISKTTKIKELLANSQIRLFDIYYYQENICFKYHFDNDEDSILVKIKKSNKYQDFLYVDINGYFYFTNGFRDNDNVFYSKCKIGITDFSGNILLNDIYDKIYVFDQTIKGFVITEINGKLGLADKFGKIAASNEYDQIYEDFTNQGLVAILVKGKDYFSINKKYKISKIDTKNSTFKEKWENYSLLSQNNKEKLLGTTLFEIQNIANREFNIYSNQYARNDNFKYFRCYEPNYKSIISKIKIINPKEQFDVIDSYYSLENKSSISYFQKIGQKIYAFIYNLFIEGDRGPSQNIPTLIVCDNKLTTIDGNNLSINEDQYWGNQSYLILNPDLICVQYYDQGKEIEINSKFIENYNLEIDTASEEDQSNYYKCVTKTLFFKINENGTIQKCQANEFTNRKFYLSKYFILHDSLLTRPVYFEDIPDMDANDLIFRQLNKQELQEMLEEILVEYNHDESKLNEIDRYNVKFLREKIANGISKIEGIK